MVKININDPKESPTYLTALAFQNNGFIIGDMCGIRYDTLEDIYINICPNDRITILDNNICGKRYKKIEKELNV